MNTGHHHQALACEAKICLPGGECVCACVDGKCNDRGRSGSIASAECIRIGGRMGMMLPIYGMNNKWWLIEIIHHTKRTIMYRLRWLEQGRVCRTPDTHTHCNRLECWFAVA